MIFFFYGPNTFTAREQISKMMVEYQKKTGSDMGLERIDGSKVTQPQLVAALQASPFLANSRLVIVEALASNKPVAANIEPITKLIPNSTVAIFYDPNVDQRTAYFKHLSSKAKTVKFDPLNPRQLHNWVKAEVALLNAEMDAPAITKLLEIAGEDQWRLKNELNKLANRNQHITLETVDEMVTGNQNETIFDLVEAMSAGNAEKAITLYKQLRADQMNEMYILTMITWQLRNLLLAKLAGSIPSAELAKKVGISPYVASKAQARGRSLDEEVIKWAFLKAVDVDYGIKTGQATGDVLIEMLIFQVARRVKR